MRADHGRRALWQVLLLLAVVPAVCEELAFRGFILSGFRHLGHRWRAIVLSAIFFGLTHGILQQSLLACLVGRRPRLAGRADRQPVAGHPLSPRP